MGRQKILYIVDHIPLPLAREGFAALYQLTRDLLPSHRSHAPLCLFGVGDSVEQKFTGQVRDSETGMDFFLARYYGSAVGRFTSPDPMNLGADPTDPQSWNAYAYVRNNPLALVDPMGLCHMGADNVAYDDEPGDCGGGSVTVTAQAPPDVMPIFVSLPSLLSDTQQPVSTAPPPAVTEAGMGVRPTETKAKIQVACLADVALNFGIGFIPGVNAVKTPLDLLGIGLHPFENAASGGKIATVDFGGLSTAAGFSDLVRTTFKIGYAARGGDLALTRARDLTSRASFFKKTAAQQRKLLRNLADIEGLTRAVSVTGGIANFLNVASSVSDAYGCLQK